MDGGSDHEKTAVYPAAAPRSARRPGVLAPRGIPTLDLGTPVKQCRLTPLDLGNGERGFVTVFSAEKSIDPYEGSFTFPKDTPKIAVFDASGRELWRRELPHTIPVCGSCRCCRWTWTVTDAMNPSRRQHLRTPLRLRHRLERADARTGRVTGSW
ncbi:MAG: hypothetical protein V8Q54_06745 [Alistipes senegalensis]